MASEQPPLVRAQPTQREIQLATRIAVLAAELNDVMYAVDDCCG